MHLPRLHNSPLLRLPEMQWHLIAIVTEALATRFPTHKSLIADLEVHLILMQRYDMRIVPFDALDIVQRQTGRIMLLAIPGLIACIPATAARAAHSLVGNGAGFLEESDEEGFNGG